MIKQKIEYLLDCFCVCMSYHPVLAGVTGLTYVHYRGLQIREVEE